MEDNRGQKIYDWIVEQTSAGRTVYASTCLIVIKIAKKHLDLVRVRGTHCEVLRGREGWVSINYCSIKAA